MDAKSWCWLPAVLLAASVACGEEPIPVEALDPPPVTRAEVARTASSRDNATPDPAIDPAPAPKLLAMPPWRTGSVDRAGNALNDAFLVDDPPSLPVGLRPPKQRQYARTLFGPIQQVASWAAASRHKPVPLPPTRAAQPAPPRPVPMPQVAAKEPQPQPAKVQPAAPLPGALARAEALAAKAETRAELSEVIDVCRSASKPSDDLRRLAAWAHNRRGELAIDRGDQLLALEDFELAIELEPSFWPAWHNRGVTFAEQGRSDDAIADFKHVLELNPRVSTAYRNRAEAYVGRGRTKEAVFDYTAAIALGPVDAGLLAARGAAHHRLGQIDRAVADFNLALKLDPQDPTALAHRGDVYAQVGNFEQAVADLEQAVRLDPASAGPHRSLAWLLATCPDERLRDPERAVTMARRAVRLAAEAMSSSDPGDGDVALHLDTLAVSLAGVGDFDAAERHGAHAVEIAPEAYRDVMQQRLAGYQRGEAYIVSIRR